MIREGQIYSNTRKFVVTSVSLKWVVVLFQGGSVYRHARKRFEKCNFELIAEYPTWQQAVNSKEFRE